MNKGRHEEFARFFEQPTRESLRDLIKRNFGEVDDLDFKEVWPSNQKIARHILGIANFGGGCLIAGMAQDSTGSIISKGLDELKDKADLQKGVQKYLPNQLEFVSLDFVYSDSEYTTLVGKKFQAIIVENKPRYLPFICSSDGDGIRAGAIYTRRGTSSEEVNYNELQAIINRRLETDYSTQSQFNLEREISELKLLYGEIQKYHYYDPDYEPDYGELRMQEENNTFYPEEELDEFIAGIIKAKKLRIKALLKINAM